MRLIAIASLMAGCAFAQKAESPLPATDAEKIADSPSAGPTFITKDRTLLDGPSSPNGEDRFSGRVRTNGTCLPSIPGYTRRTRTLRPRIFSVDERQYGRAGASH
jgi:hypothetical protein